MDIVTAEQMRRLDRLAIEEIGLPAMVLMERAGQALAEETEALLRQLGQGAGRVLVLAGKGNNGGDGMVALRHLVERGIGCDLLLAEPPDRLKGEAAQQFAILRKLGISASVWCGNRTDEDVSKTTQAVALDTEAAGRGVIDTGSAVPWHRYALIVDALLGTGTGGSPREPYASLIRAAAATKLPVLAADMPSGLDADSGALHEPCLPAVKTVAFAFLKRGLALYPGAEAAGEVVVRPIGIPERLASETGGNVAMLSERMLRERLDVDPRRPRRPDTHKGSYGHALVVAGSLRMSGAGLLCTRAALRAGSGLVTWAVPDSLAPHLLGRVPEAMLAGIPDAGLGDWAATSAEDVLALAKDRSVLVLGPGMGRYDGDGEWLRAIWEGARCPLVLDADALNMLAAAGDFAEWPRRQAAAVLTPHPGEMARLTGMSVAEVQRDRIEVARRFADEHHVTLVLKGARTVVASPGGRIWMNPTGNPGMATGGSGDVLAGIMAGLLAQNLSAEQAAALGVWLHGAAGDRAVARLGSPASLLAGDLIEEL